MRNTISRAAAIGVIALAGSLTIAAPAMAEETGGSSVAANEGHHVTVPGDYKVTTHTQSPTLHDYCTKSPDQFPAVGKNADFRGPCARHDQCIERKKPRGGCDSQLRNDMYSECNYAYRGGWYFVHRQSCLRTADVYYGVVTTNTHLFH